MKSSTQITFIVIASIILALIAYQDFRYLAVSWILFAAGFILFFITGWLTLKFGVQVYYILLNSAFVIVQLGSAMLYIYFRKKDLKAVKGYLGSGDLLFFLLLCLVLSPVNFIIFNLVSLLLALLVFIFYRKTGGKDRRIPLAGFQALYLAGVMAVDYSTKYFNMYNDNWIIGLVY